MLTLTPAENAVLNAIRGHAKGSEITTPHVMMQAGLKDKEARKVGISLRAIINSLRRNGVPVLSNTNGYYMPTSDREIEEFIKSFEHRVAEQQAAIDGLKHLVRQASLL